MSCMDPVGRDNSLGSLVAVPAGESCVELLARLCLGARPAGDFQGTPWSAVPGEAGSLPLHPSCAADRELPEAPSSRLQRP